MLRATEEPGLDSLQYPEACLFSETVSRFHATLCSVRGGGQRPKPLKSDFSSYSSDVKHEWSLSSTLPDLFILSYLFKSRNNPSFEKLQAVLAVTMKCTVFCERTP